MHEIIPGILESNFEEIEKKLAIIKPFSRKVHIDVMDGKFCEQVNYLNTEPFKKYKNDFFMEVHLMVDDPTNYVKKYADVGFNRFLGHIEKMKDLEEFIALGQIFGEVGVAIDADTEIESLKLPFNDLDCLLLMGVKAGQSGQEFLPQILEKIRKIKALTQIPITIDGGINDKTITQVRKEGVERFVATSFIFNSSDPIKAYESLLSLEKTI
jgi:ribulose-phosphate 3-epimerase